MAPTRVTMRKPGKSAQKVLSKLKSRPGYPAMSGRPIQGAAADVIRRAMVRVGPALKRKKLAARMLLQVHDELIFEAPEAEVEETIKVAVGVMERADQPAVKLSVPLKVDARAADNWDEAH